METTFNDFFRLFVYIHTSNIYKHKAWVAVDGDTRGKEVIKKLGETFKWPEKHFRNFSKDKFEFFYPNTFEEDRLKILDMPSGKDKNYQKGELAKNVLSWASKNPTQAKDEFEKSASEIISFLKEIEKELN